MKDHREVERMDLDAAMFTHLYSKVLFWLNLSFDDPSGLPKRVAVEAMVTISDSLHKTSYLP